MTAQLATRVIRARRPSQCPVCRGPIRVGDQIAKCGVWMCVRCAIDHQHDETSSGEPMAGYQALQGAQIGPHRIDVPGRHEAEALTDCCPRVGCRNDTKPAAVLDRIERGRNSGRIAAYRCRICDAAWLCWWAAP